jgi:putative nucleotidyltransferase with HDIG domain
VKHVGSGQPEISVRAVSTVALYFESVYGRSRLEEAYARVPGAPPLSEIFEPNNYLSFDLTALILDVLTEASEDPDFPRKSGAWVATPKGIGFAYYMLRALGSPQLVYQKVVDVAGTINRLAEFKFRKLGNQHVEITYRSSRVEPNHRLCEARQGQFAAFPTIWGVPEAAVVERTCQVRGDAECLYDITWQPLSRPVLNAIAGGAAGAAASALFFAHSLGPWEGSALGLAVGGAFSVALGYRRQARDASDRLRTQDEGLSAALRDIQRRFDEIQQLNQTLEQRVADRTQELSIATAQLQTALDKQLELDRLKTRFFQNISHELRTPLTLILAPLDTMADQPGLSNDMRMQFDIMRRSAVRLLGLINSLLDLSRLEAGKLRLTLEDADVAYVCRQLVENAQQLAQQRGIDLRFEGPERLPLVPIDQDKFEKSVMNLISNALKFTGNDRTRPATVTVSAEIVADRLHVKVADTGIGIPKSELANIFQRFHQVDGSDERQFGGTGIGLALVKELIEFHMGTVEVTSVLGEGATFELTLPTMREAYPPERLDRRRASEAVAVDRRKLRDRQKLEQLIANPAELALADLQPAAEASSIEVVAEKRPLVLLADDNPDMLAYLATILRREYDVITAADGEEAAELAQQHAPDIIVSDVMMPRKNGHALLQELKALPSTRSIPIILVTAKAEPYQKVAGIEMGADDYLTKPFNFLELRARIRGLLKQRSLERSLAEKNDYLEKLNFDLVLSKKEVFVQTIEAMAFALEAKDSYTHGHSRRVSLLSTELGREMGLSELEIERVRIAAVLHDIGKLGIPEHILRKEGRLNAEEEEIIRRHPEIGYRILESVRELGEVNRCILLHHEKFDGTGYPHGKQGIHIPLESRIIAVTDTYDAMTSDRPYRAGLGHRRAIEELVAYSGSQFDPEIVRSFLRLYDSRPPVFPEFPSVFARLKVN